MSSHDALEDRKQLEEIQSQLANAWITRDSSTLERILAPEWMVHTDGHMSTKDEVLHDFDTTAQPRLVVLPITGRCLW